MRINTNGFSVAGNHDLPIVMSVLFDYIRYGVLQGANGIRCKIIFGAIVHEEPH